MKVLLVFAVVVTTSYAVTYTQEMMSKEYADKLKEDVRKCNEIYAAVNNDNLRKILNKEILPTQNEQCYILCYAKNRGYYVRPGQMNLDKMKSDNAKKYKVATNLAGANEIDTECVKQAESETNDCKTALKFYVCRTMEGKARGFKFVKYNGQ